MSHNIKTYIYWLWRKIHENGEILVIHNCEWYIFWSIKAFYWFNCKIHVVVVICPFGILSLRFTLYRYFDWDPVPGHVRPSCILEFWRSKENYLWTSGNCIYYTHLNGIHNVIKINSHMPEGEFQLFSPGRTVLLPSSRIPNN